METKAFQNLLESIMNLNEDHMKGKTVIVNGKRGLVGKEVSQDGQTENDGVYRVKFEDGTTKNIPARDMEIAGDTKNKKQPSENEAEDAVSEDHDCEKVHPDMSHEKWSKKAKNESYLDESQRWADEVSIPANKQTKDIIEHPKAKILMNVPSTLSDKARFVVIQRPLGHKGELRSNQDKVLMATISDPKGGRVKMFAFHGSHVSHQKAMQFAKNHKLVKKKDAKGNPLYAKESYLYEDNTAAVAKQVKQAVKKYTTGKLAVQSKGGKTRFIMVRADKIDNELRKKVLNVVAPTANVRDKSNISYGNISDRIISASVEQWMKALGLKESVEVNEDQMSDREVTKYTKAATAMHTKAHKKAFQIIKFIDSVEKHKQKWVDSFGDYVTAKLPKQLKLSSKGSVEYQQGRGRGDWSFIIDGENVRYNNRDMPWMPKSGTLKFDAFMKLLDAWKKNANKPKSTGGHMGRQTESVELDEIKWDKDERRIVPKWEKDLHKATSKIKGIVRGLKNGKEVHSYRTGGTMMTSAVGVLMRDFGADTVELVVRGKVVYTVKKKDVMKNGKMIDESVELDEAKIISGRMTLKVVYQAKDKKEYEKLMDAATHAMTQKMLGKFGVTGDYKKYTVEIEFKDKKTRKKFERGFGITESRNLNYYMRGVNESKMSEIDAGRREGQTAAQIAGNLKVDVKHIKSVLKKGVKKGVKKESIGEDHQCAKEVEKQNMQGVGIGIPAINNKKWGTGGFTNSLAKIAKKAIKENMDNYDSYSDWKKAGFPKKKEAPKKEDPKSDWMRSRKSADHAGQASREQRAKASLNTGD